MFEQRGILFWPVGTGDCTTIVVEEDTTIFQVDMRHQAQSDNDTSEYTPIIDELESNLPKVDGKPYLSAFALTHPDNDHIQGFEELLKRITIGEIWFTPRVFREQTQDLCDDAVAFRKEGHRRVRATIEAEGDPGSGNRVRLIGYDTLLEEERYQGFPRAFFSIPGHTVTKIDGKEFSDVFQAFIHAPFKDDTTGDRNDTSLAMQIVLGQTPSNGGLLLFGDLKYPRIRKIFDVSTENDNRDKLAWQVMLSAHHCSKSVMYQEEDGRTVLKQDILDDMENTQVGDGYIIASSDPIPSSNSPGDNPPHAKARNRYQEIAQGEFLCTHEDGEKGKPLLFILNETNLQYSKSRSGATHSDESGLRKAVEHARGSDKTPSTKAGFGCGA